MFDIDPVDALLERDVTDAFLLLEGEAGRAATLPLFLTLPEETRELVEEGRALCGVWLFRPSELRERREDGFAAELPGLRLRLEGLIVGFIVADPEGTALCRPEFLRVGLTSGCRACIVSSPRREASVRLKATREI